MWVGAGRIVLDFYGNTELKVKRRQLDLLCKELRKRYNISVLEVADNDDPERCVLGFAAAMPEDWRDSGARGFVQKICNTIDEIAFARVSIEDCDIWVHGEEV